jgi:DNA-binding response OmpR family regulator
VVEDNRDVADFLAMFLRLEGNEVYTAHDGAEALEKAEQSKPDVVLLDLGLPRMSGYEVCRAMRQAPWGKEITIYAVSGWGQEEDKRKSSEAGFNAHLVKPVEPTSLSALLAATPVRVPPR